MQGQIVGLNIYDRQQQANQQAANRDLDSEHAVELLAGFLHQANSIGQGYGANQFDRR